MQSPTGHRGLASGSWLQFWGRRLKRWADGRHNCMGKLLEGRWEARGEEAAYEGLRLMVVPSAYERLDAYETRSHNATSEHWKGRIFKMGE